MTFLTLGIVSRGESKAAVGYASTKELVRLLKAFSAFISIRPCFDQIDVNGLLGYTIQDVAQELEGIVRLGIVEFVSELERQHSNVIDLSIIHKFGS